MLVDENGDIWFRQSWVSTANRCNERGRLSLVYPTEGSNDLAVVGTCAHAGIQAVLDEKISADDVPEYTYRWALAHCEENPIRWVDLTLPGQVADLAVQCVRAFTAQLLPSIQRGGRTEVSFKVPLFEYDGHTVGILGTSDYVPPFDPVIYDWKTASRKYDQRVKQRTDVQPTVYAMAAVRGAFGEPFDWPVMFRYGVMVRGREAATTQLVTVQRTHAHEGWMLDQMRTYLNLAKGLGVTDTHWPRDEDHYLCNEKWCPWWSMCKGARLSADDDNWTG